MAGKRSTTPEPAIGQELGALWEAQREVLVQAGRLVQDAGRRVADFTGDEVVPRVRSAASAAQDAAVSGAQATRRAALAAKEKVVADVLPAVSGALRSASTLVELAKSPALRETVRRGGSRARAVLSESAKQQRLGAGAVALIGLGVVFAAGVGYAAWRTLRADDELWAGTAENEPSEPTGEGEGDEFFG